MSYSESFPTQRPIFTLDAANAGRLDSRISYTRSTTGSFYGKDKHLSSDNLLLQSSNFITSWFPNGINGTPTGGQGDPAGGTDGFTVVEDSAVGAVHRIFQAANASGDLAFTVYAKQNSGTRYLTLTLFNANNNWTAATFDLAGGSPATGSGSSSVFSSVSATQSASGNGYYKCTIKATGALAGYVYIYLGSSTAAPTGTYGSVTHTGDGTSSIDIAFASLSTTGATDYNATTTQLHRAYAPTLQTAAINAPRFEFSASDSASAAMGESLGLLVEGSSTNLLPYSSDASQLSGVKNEVESNAAIAPDGTLTADKMRVDDAVGTGNSLRIGTWSVTSGQKYTISYYAKAAELGFIVINFRNLNSAFASAHAYYNLNTGTVDANSGLDSYGMESCGNGWYRCWATATATATATGTYYLWAVNDAAGTPIDRDGYSGVLIWGGQIENQSFPSSYIATSGSTVTRAADSAAIAVSDLGLTSGQDVSIITEANWGDPTDNPYGRFALALATDGNNRIAFYNNNGQNGSGWVRYSGSDSAFFNPGTTSGGYAKLGISAAMNSFNYAFNGTAGTEDTAGVVPEYTELEIGSNGIGTQQLDGHIKRVAVYGQSLSSTELAAVTS